jgi:signal transduction histidine kinase
VTDHGPGIEPGVQQQIFEPFKRAVTSKQYDGLGLGLYIVRSVVAQLNGVVRVTSAPGCGATFTVELPLNQR